MTRKKSENTEFTGELATPIRWTGPGPGPVFPTSRAKVEAYKRWAEAEKTACMSVAEQRMQKVVLLSQRYGITSDGNLNDFIREMLFAVCNEFIPGFRIKRPTRRGGRPRKWVFRYAQLLADVEAVKMKKNCTQRDALKELIANRVEYRPANGAYRTSETLKKAIDQWETRLNEAKKMWGHVVEIMGPKDFVEQFATKTPL